MLTTSSHDALDGWNGLYDNPTYDALVEAAVIETDPYVRLALYEQAEALLVMTDTVIAPLFNPVNHNLTRPDLERTYRSIGGQHLEEWSFSGGPRPLEIVWGYPDGLDPASSRAYDYLNQLFLGLTAFDETGAVVPKLGTGWDISPDGLVYTFTMRSDAYWTDGQKVTAGDVEYGVLRSLDPDIGRNSWMLYTIKNAAAYNQGDITDPGLVGVEALDDTHVRFTLAEPAAYFPMIVALAPARPQPRWTIEAYRGAWTDPANIVTNGPYKLVHWDQRSQVSINKQGSDFDPIAGEQYVFNITYSNEGGDPAADCVITDTMLGGMTYISDTSGFAHSGSGSGPIVWNLGTLRGYAEGEFQVHVQITAYPGKSITNKVQIATSNPDDAGNSQQKESEWRRHVVGPFMRVDYAQDFVGGVYPAGHTMWLTVTNSLGGVKATATVNTVVDGAGHGYWEKDGFVTESADWSNKRPDIEPNDTVRFRSDDGYENTIRIGTISGFTNPAVDTASGVIHAPWFANQTVTVIVGYWGFTFRSSVVDLDHTGTGRFFVDFSPEDLLPGEGVDVDYIEPDGDKVIGQIHPARWIFLPVVQIDSP